MSVWCQRVDFGPAWSIGRQGLRRRARAISLACGRFGPDVVYAHQNMPAAAAILARPGVPIVADFHALPSIEWMALAGGSRPPESLGHAAAGVRAAAAEAFVARGADAVIAAGESLGLAVMRRYRLSEPPAVVPNGVDRHLLDSPPAKTSPYEGLEGDRHALAILPAAATPANARALSFLCAAAEELSGGSPTVAIHVLGSASGPSAPLLRYHGLAPDLVPWIEHADVCLLPYPREAALYGGAKNKTLEYLARGRALVTTPEGLWGVEEAAGLDGVHVVSHEPADFAAAVRAAAADGAKRLDPTRELIRNGFRWDVLAARVAGTLRALVELPAR